MSGIAGIIHFDGRPVEPGQVEAMTAAMHYRGPDGINHWRRGNVALGQCMLRTTPESLEETQPLTNEDESLVLVMDGRVDNWEELRRELLGKGAVLRTRADAELVLRAYEVWGRDCPCHIEGDFALVIWDARQQAAFCARDRVGNKSFHYHWNGCSFAFATDLHSLLPLSWVPEVLNLDTVAEYLGSDWYSLDQTLWQDVLRLEPAHDLFIKDQGQLERGRYWMPDLHATLPCRTDDEYAEYYKELLGDAVRRLSRSHRPLTIEVSGGLDSSAIFAMAEQQRRQGILPAPDLEGYTLDFSGDPFADEMDYARAVAAHVGRPVHEVAPAHMPLEWYRETAAQFRDFPDYPNGAMAISIAERAKAAGSLVLLSGTGGDEWVGGCRLYYAEAIAAFQMGDLYDMWRRDMNESGLLEALWRPFRHGLLPLLPDRWRHLVRLSRAKIRGKGLELPPPWMSSTMQARLMQRRQQSLAQASMHLPRLGQRRLLQNMHEPYVAVARGINDRRAARMGMEWRQPFWDLRFMEAAFATPEYLRMKGNENKWLHRKAMAGLLPKQVLQRQTKAEFSGAYKSHWDELAPWIRSKVMSRRAQWIHSDGLVRAIDEAFSPESGQPYARAVWTLFGLDAMTN